MARIEVWDSEYTAHRAPPITDLRADPFERASGDGNSWRWQEWMFRRGYVFVPAQTIVGGFLKSFEEFPPRAKPASFSVGDALKSLETATQGK
ncbi:MAG: hypothetical protein EP299_00910 [Acidobacteria bacterium]|nr:MAG: hypothetical protein EP299_00910 [Acidobacteriota bacterium]